MLAYKITNRINGKCYIGVTTNSIRKRWNEHKCAAKAGDDKLLYRAMRKYGLDNFELYEVGKTSSTESLMSLERTLIAAYGSFMHKGFGYNMTTGGEGMNDAPRHKGEAVVNSVLTEDVVRFIRDPCKRNMCNRELTIATNKEFSTVFLQGTLRDARRGDSWKYLDATCPPIKTKQGSRASARVGKVLEDCQATLKKYREEAIAKSADLRRGKRGANARLTEQQVIEIFFADGPSRKIGAQYKVDKAVVLGIKARKQHVYITKEL